MPFHSLDVDRIRAEPELSRSRRRAEARLAEVRLAQRAERPDLLAWLNRGLRPEGGRLEAEHPIALASRAAGVHVIACAGEAPVAHAFAVTVRARAAGHRLPIGLIGMVYTEAAWRGRGLASRCVASAVERLAAGGARVILLWSDLDGLYRRLGFVPGGTEWAIELDAASGAAARSALGAFHAVRAPQEADWAALESLYAAKASYVERPTLALQRLAAAPGVTLRVAHRAGHPTAYAAAGRGADLAGVVHEWAGDAAGAAACVEALRAEHGARELLAGPDPAEDLLAGLRRGGAHAVRRALGWVRVPDPPALWRELLTGPEAPTLHAAGAGFVLRGARGACPLSREDVTQLLLGPERPLRWAEALSAPQYLAVRRTLPWPLYLWGFDSV